MADWSPRRSASVGGFDVLAELPQIDLDTRGGARDTTSLSMRSAAHESPRRTTGSSTARSREQRDADVAPGGDRVEIGPHQLADALTAQRAGEDEQLEQRAHPLASQLGHRRHRHPHRRVRRSTVRVRRLAPADAPRPARRRAARRRRVAGSSSSLAAASSSSKRNAAGASSARPSASSRPDPHPMAMARAASSTDHTNGKVVSTARAGGSR